ncbi:MAG: GNAT family N-acetyltransferase [Cyanobacteria bacterium J06633_2]
MTQTDEWSMRPAKSDDVWAIRRLVLSAWLDPTQIRWQQFWIIERVGLPLRRTYRSSISSATSPIIGCGQLRNFDDAQELGSLVIHSKWRHHGLGTALTQKLIDIADRPLYLECLGDRLCEFYTHLGFLKADWATMPSSMKKKFQTTRWLAQVLPVPLHIMQHSVKATDR